MKDSVADASHKERPSPLLAYRTWEQTSGYFDGDGNVGLEIAKYILRFRIRFVDTWRQQVEAVRAFVIAQGLATTNVSVERIPNRNDAFRIEIGALGSFLKAAKAMLPFCVKKAEDLRIAIDYIEDRVTGNEAIARFNQEIVEHRRSGYLRGVDLPFTRSIGVRAKELENARKARLANAVHVDEEVQNQIRKDHAKGLGIIRLSKRYGYSQSVIRRILRGP